MSTRMKMFFSIVLLFLAAHNGLGAPIKARYMFVRCNPNGDQANCVTHHSSPLKMDPDLPARLPASAAQYLDSEAVQEEEWQEPEGEGPEPQGEGPETDWEETETEWEETEPEEEGPLTDWEQSELDGEGPVTEGEGPETEWEEPVTEMGESQTGLLFPEEGSGFEEGSAVWPGLMADRAFIPAEPETGSGDALQENTVDPEQGAQSMTSLKASTDPPAQELREDHLLQ